MFSLADSFCTLDMGVVLSRYVKPRTGTKETSVILRVFWMALRAPALYRASHYEWQLNRS